jgi:hypothetical protein
MTRSENSLRDFYLRDDYWGYKRPGWKQLLCAWFIVLTVAMLFRITDLVSPNRSAPSALATDLAQRADIEQTGDIERWERGVPRQRTMTLPSPESIALLSRVDQ